MSTIKKTLAKIVNKENLTQHETSEAFREIMTGQATDPQIAAWVTALRMKGETVDEITGCLEIMRDKVHAIDCDIPFAVDSVGTGGDGAHTINISTTAAIVAAGAGAVVAKHGNRAVSSKSGSADVLAALGINLQITPEQMKKALRTLGFTFLFAPNLHPAMKHAVNPRRQIGIRTIFNLLGPMANPAKVKRGVIGVFDAHYCRLLAETALKTNMEHMLFVHGADGLDEISLSGPTTICEIRNGEIHEYTLAPEDFGFERCTAEDIKGGEPEENARTIIETLNGAPGPKRDIVVLNAAAVIFVADLAKSWSEAIEKAKESIDYGAALKKLQDFTALSNS